MKYNAYDRFFRIYIGKQLQLITPNQREQTMQELDRADVRFLETIIDQNGLKPVLLAISDICSDKAEHVKVNWQDEMLANAWTATARRLYDTMMLIKNIP